MARINIQDDIESHSEFWRLLPLVGGDRDVALGKLVRFFRIAQKAYGIGQPIEETELAAQGLLSMIESAWAVPADGGGYRCKGDEKHFGWYRQKVASSVAGGRARSAAPRDEGGRFLPGSSRDPAGNEPRSSLPSPSPSPSQRKKNTGLAGARIEYPEAFEGIWKQYQVGKKPRGEKKASLEVFQKLNLSEAELLQLKRAIAGYLVANPEERYRLHFQRFLNSDWRVHAGAAPAPARIKTIEDVMNGL